MELAKTLQDVKENSRDYIVPTTAMKMEAQPAGAVLEAIIEEEQKKIETKPVLVFPINGGTKAFDPTPWAHQQIALYSDVPKAYYDRLAAENPDLLARNVNHGLLKQVLAATEKRKNEVRMLRTWGPNLRALVSSRYRRLDCYDLLEAVLPLFEQHNFEIATCELTDRRMYVKALLPKLEAEIKVGDAVRYGLVISGSDVAAGSVRVEPMLLRLVCMNGAIMEASIRKFHVGRDQKEGDGIYELLTDETKELTDAAFWHQVRDVVAGSMDPQIFEQNVDKMREASGQKITNYDIPEVVDLTAQAIGVRPTEEARQSMVAYLANGADGAGLTKWGLMNAVTQAASSDKMSFDDCIDWERSAARILELHPKSWDRIATRSN
jgi:hypothetical protein